MIWNLFIDDERDPKQCVWAPGMVYRKYVSEDWLVARTWKEVAEVIRAQECLPNFISFDHDLGDNEPTGYDIVKMLIEDALDHPDEPSMQFPRDFDFFVHSKNPIGKVNIEMLLTGFISRRYVE